MTKKLLISEIQKIIYKTGFITMGEMESECSPVHNSIGKDHFQLIEGIDKDSVTISEYIHDNEIDSYDIPIEDVSRFNLKTILIELQRYQEKNIEAFCE